MKKKWQKLAVAAFASILVLIPISTIAVSYQLANILTQRPAEQRIDAPDVALLLNRPPQQVLAEYQLSDYQRLTLTTVDGFELAAMYFPSQNGAAVMVQHGYTDTLMHMIPITAMLVRHGYGVILTELRAHGDSEGNLISFGHYEMNDLDAAYHYLLTRSEVDPNRIGILGNSMGGSLAILYAAERNLNIKAVIAQSPYDSVDEAIGKILRKFAGLPNYPFGPMTVFFAERKLDSTNEQFAPINVIRKLSPRPVFIMMGGQDSFVNPDGGIRLFEAAGEPRRYWYDSTLEHVAFSKQHPAEFETAITDFFDHYLQVKS